ncbi:MULTISPECIES: DMT family transporter [unclassified Crossiella]|uniref:DMT family transporter n=1 Tax=unclassified Crossiella TaxID=2620835 RepID=UPI001FFE40CB|nr:MULTISPECIES: DMT family transporter [unclassified Crossiella]MCK2236334.1 DMT family transporter [Crossiella sp. S99.2]MCK2250001.1 DMT family transporter [Crossiella sp. S99.1]
MSQQTAVRGAGLAGIGLGIGANLIWGLAFLVPVLLPEFSPVAVTLGRYVCYGLLSVALIVFTGTRLRGHSWPVWRSCLLFAVTGNVGYYFLLVQGIALVGAPVVAVIIGTLPVTVAVYGNLRRREFPFRRLALPVGVILAGLVAVNLSEIDWSGLGGRSLGAQLLGVGCAVLALAMWTWFGVANAHFLRTNPQVGSADWSTLIGIATLGLSVLAAPLLLVTGDAIGRGIGADSLWYLLLGSLVLGVLVSWGGTLLWNQASSRLPVSVAGQLIVFETISGLVYVFLASGKTPPLLGVAGMAVVLVGVLIGIRQARAA